MHAANCKINGKTGFLEPEHMAKDTKINFPSRILMQLRGTNDLLNLLA